jgi:hypothetical protein
MAIYIRLAPGIKIRIGKRGRTRIALGSRLLGAHFGAGGTGVSTGAGPVSLYKALRRRRRR